MAENTSEIITRYLEDVIAAERNFEDQLTAISKMGDQAYVRQLFAEFAAGAKSQHEQLTARLKSLGGRPSTLKSFLAHVLAFSSMAGQAGQDAAEKSTQHLIMAAGAASAEAAMYEALAAAADAGGDSETAQLARRMQQHELSDREKAWNLLARSARESFQSGNGGGEAIARYIQDAIAAEKTFEDQLRSFAKMGDLETVQQLFARHADETRLQWERLEARLKALGGSTLVSKSMLAHLFAFAPAAAQVGHSASEKNTQHLIIACAVENAEVAMYEALATAAAAAGDMETERLARDIQAEERRTAELEWSAIAQAARQSLVRTSGGSRAA